MGESQEVNSPKISHNFPRRQWGSIGKVKLSPKKLSDQPEIFSISCYGIFNKII